MKNWPANRDRAHDCAQSNTCKRASSSRQGQTGRALATVLPWLLHATLVPGISFAATASWEFGKDSNNDGAFDPGTQVSISAGNQVNQAANPPGPANRLRVVVNGLQSGVTVQQIRIREDDWWGQPGVDHDRGDFIEDWPIAATGDKSVLKTPPSQSGDAGAHAEFFAKVTLSDGTILETAIIIVPHARVTASNSVTTREASETFALEAQGAVLHRLPASGVGRANLQLSVSSATQSKKVLSTTDVYFDPPISFDLTLLSTLPSGWSVYVDPPSAMVGPGETVDVNLNVLAQTTGEVWFQVTSSSNGLQDATDPLLLRVVEGSGGSTHMPDLPMVGLIVSFTLLLLVGAASLQRRKPL